ncbi:MAG: hypothetical protein ACI4PQ_06480 [Butyricicoccaceae bacterium]
MKNKLSFFLRMAACGVLIAVCFLLQSSIHLTVWGVHIDLLPAIAVCAGVVMGPPAGLVAGMLVGIAYDVSGASVEGLYPIYYMLCGVTGGVVGRYFLGRTLSTSALISLCSVGVLSILRYLFYFHFDTASTSYIYYIKGITAQVLLVTLLVPVAYLLIRVIAGAGRGK